MNKLPVAKRVQILSMLCEGSSMRSVSRVADVSINTVSKMLVDAGEVCSAYHDQYVRNLQSKRIQCDEIWSFCYSKLPQRGLRTPRKQSRDRARTTGTKPKRYQIVKKWFG